MKKYDTTNEKLIEKRKTDEYKRRAEALRENLKKRKAQQREVEKKD